MSITTSRSAEGGSELRRARRYYLSKRRFYLLQKNPIADNWRTKQEREPGTPLPGSFPCLDRLVPAGYSTIEDIDGADVGELRQAGLTTREAEAVLTALAALL